MRDRNFTPRLGQGDLPDVSDIAMLTAKNFRDAVAVWDVTFPDYKDVLYAEVVGDLLDTPLFEPRVEGDWRMLLRSQRYRNTQTKEVIYTRKYLELRDGFTDAMHVPVTTLADRLAERDINLHQWTREMAMLGRDAHLVGYMFGAGGYNAITAGAVSDLEETLRFQFSHLLRLARDVLDGNRDARQDPPPSARVVTYRGLRRRGIMFVESITRSFERARATTYGFHPDLLPHYPADGSTECLARCRCHWRFRFIPGQDSYYHAFWRLRFGFPDGRNCLTCLTYAQIYNPYTVVRF